MKFNELKVGQKVYDFWYQELGTGVVKLLLKTKVVIYFNEKTITYDRAHVRFLLPDSTTRLIVDKNGRS